MVAGFDLVVRVVEGVERPPLDAAGGRDVPRRLGEGRGRHSEGLCGGGVIDYGFRLKRKK